MLLLNQFLNSQRLSDYAEMGLGNPVTLVGNSYLSHLSLLFYHVHL